MPMNSVNTSVGSLVALQQLNATNSQLDVVQSRINTGLKVASAKDNGAIWAIAQNQRSNSSALNAVKDSLQRVQSTVDVTLSAGETVADLLNQMKEKALASSDSSLDTASRNALNTDFTALRDQITKTIKNATFNGANLLDGTTGSLAALANTTGTAASNGLLTVAGQNFSLGGSIVSVQSSDTISTAAKGLSMITAVNNSITAVASALAQLGTGSKTLAGHLSFVNKMQDTIDAGVGNLVDADLAKESAKLQSLQTKQQLGIQALSIANSSSRELLGLFR